MDHYFTDFDPVEPPASAWYVPNENNCQVAVDDAASACSMGTAADKLARYSVKWQTRMWKQAGEATA